VNNESERMWKEVVVTQIGYCPAFAWTRTPSQDNRSPDRGVKPGPLEYETVVLPTNRNVRFGSPVTLGCFSVIILVHDWEHWKKIFISILWFSNCSLTPTQVSK
jgi:hypothetical protein